MDTANDVSHSSLTISQELSQLISNISAKELDFFTDHGIELLHDLRVDLRKLRSWLQIMKKAGYPVKKLFNHTVYAHSMCSELRNFDVLLHWIHTNNKLVSPKLRDKITVQRNKLEKVFLKELTHKNTLHKLRKLGRNFLPHINQITKSDLHPYVEEYLKSKRVHLNHLLTITSGDLEQLHEMRKILKKIRYSTQLLPTFNPKQLEKIKELQNVLGYINDRRVWIEILQSHFKNSKEASDLQDTFKADIQMRINEFKIHISTNKMPL